ncbi:uncharacterized protein LOC142980533 [Anticarsia gemmatalis]|uniref:uncharacterized protein LOC142980533 n=1 Tax=Anticarsia gemmatalis TaxID=129554 RepID=UPI003F7579CB
MDRKTRSRKRALSKESGGVNNGDLYKQKMRPQIDTGHSNKCPSKCPLHKRPAAESVIAEGNVGPPHAKRPSSSSLHNLPPSVLDTDTELPPISVTDYEIHTPHEKSSAVSEVPTMTSFNRFDAPSTFPYIHKKHRSVMTTSKTASNLVSYYSTQTTDLSPHQMLSSTVSTTNMQTFGVPPPEETPSSYSFCEVPTTVMVSTEIQTNSSVFTTVWSSPEAPTSITYSITSTLDSPRILPNCHEVQPATTTATPKFYLIVPVVTTTPNDSPELLEFDSTKTTQENLSAIKDLPSLTALPALPSLVEQSKYHQLTPTNHTYLKDTTDLNKMTPTVSSALNRPLQITELASVADTSLEECSNLQMLVDAATTNIQEIHDLAQTTNILHEGNSNFNHLAPEVATTHIEEIHALAQTTTISLENNSNFNNLAPEVATIHIEEIHDSAQTSTISLENNSNFNNLGPEVATIHIEEIHDSAQISTISIENNSNFNNLAPEVATIHIEEIHDSAQISTISIENNSNFNNSAPKVATTHIEKIHDLAQTSTISIENNSNFNNLAPEAATTHIEEIHDLAQTSTISIENNTNFNNLAPEANTNFEETTDFDELALTATTSPEVPLDIDEIALDSFEAPPTCSPITVDSSSATTTPEPVIISASNSREGTPISPTLRDALLLAAATPEAPSSPDNTESSSSWACSEIAPSPPNLSSKAPLSPSPSEDGLSIKKRLRSFGTKTETRYQNRKNTAKKAFEESDINYGSENDSVSEDECEDLTFPVFVPRAQRSWFDNSEHGLEENMKRKEDLQKTRKSKPKSKSVSTASLTFPKAIESSTVFDFNWKKLPNPPINPSVRREEFAGDNVGPTVSFPTPYEAFTAIWDREIMQYIAKETNRYAREMRRRKLVQKEVNGPLCNIEKWCDTHANELYVYFGLLLATGLSVKSSIKEYWSTEDFMHSSNFARYMNFDRFSLITNCLHFNNNDLLDSAVLSRSQAKLFKIAPILTHLNQKFQSLYRLDQNITIDDSLLHWKGWPNIKELFKNRAESVGMESYELCESHTGYLWRFKVHTRQDKDIRQTTPECEEIETLVIELLRGLENKGHTVWLDSFYSSPYLARILKSLGFDCVGILRTNCRSCPSQLATLKKSDMGAGDTYGFTSGDVDVLVWRDERCVALISTYHGAEIIRTVSGKIKPLAIHDYSVYTCGVDKKNLRLSTYPLIRKRPRAWYKKLFRRLLNVSVINAFILHNHSQIPLSQKHYEYVEFRKTLINQLLTSHASKRVVRLRTVQN